MQFVVYEARMNQPVLDGEGKVKSTVRDELSSYWKANPERYEPPPDIPPNVEHLWECFIELDRHREVNEYGVRPLSPQIIDSTARLLDWELEPHEVRALYSIDHVYRNPPKKVEEES